MKVDTCEFGKIVIDGREYTKDIILDNGEIKRRKKKKSKPYKKQFGHTPLSTEEYIPWNCNTLVIGSGMEGALPVMDDVKNKAVEKGVELIIVPTGSALTYINKKKTNLVLHITC